MRRTTLRSKIHRATVTQADLHYVGSLTVDAGLMAADLLPGEQVHVVDINVYPDPRHPVAAQRRALGRHPLRGSAPPLVRQPCVRR